MALKKNLDVLIQEKLYEEIVQGNWTPGQTLNLDELAEQYGVSRTPVQQALKKMNTLGMISFSSKGHFSVMAFGPKEVHDIIEVRLLLEEQAIRDMQSNGTAIDSAGLGRVCQACIACCNAGDIIQARRMDLEFHHRLIAQAENRCLGELYEKVQGQFMVVNYLMTTHTHVQETIAADDHDRILQALNAGRYDEAAALLQAHIMGAYQKILERIDQSAS